MDLDQLIPTEPAPFGLHRPCRRPSRSRGFEQNLPHAAEPLGREPEVGRRRGQFLNRDGDQEKAGACGGGDVEDHVGRGAAAALGVVVHTGEIVVHQRVGVHDLHRGGNAGDARSGAPGGIVAGEHQCRPDPLAAGAERVGQCLTVSAAGSRRSRSARGLSRASMSARASRAGPRELYWPCTPSTPTLKPRR